MLRLLFLLLVSPLLVWAQSGTSLLNGDPLSCFTRVDGGSRVSFTTVDATGPGFTRAWRLTTNSMSANAWDLRLRCFSTVAVKRGDVSVATFYVRSARSTPAFTTFVVEQSVSPFGKPASWTAQGRQGEWRRVDVPFVFDQDYAAGGYNLSFWVNFDPQEIEIGGFSILNYGQNVKISDLRLPNYPYEGAAANAPWRAAAAERIERLRKANIGVVLRDPEGRPFANVPVRIRMKKHAFGFGTAVAGSRLADNSTDGQRYRDFLRANFNKAVLENDLKWPFWETWARNTAESGLTWLRNNGIPVRGHTVVWPGRSNLPTDVQNMLNANPVDQNALRNRINTHIDAVMNYTKGRVTEWDVINEPYTNKDLMQVLGNAEMIEWLRRARRNDPDIKLFINDYDNVEDGGFNLAHIRGFYDILKFVIDGGAPLDGIGIQAHFGGNLTPPDRVMEILDLYASLGKDLQVTEFDINIQDEEAQAQYTRDFLTICFSHPRMMGFLMWGFWEGQHWLPNGAMVRRDWSTKPNFQAWRDLVYRDWWTSVDGTTDANGAFQSRGFLGEYEVEYVLNGQTVVAPLLVAAGQPNTLVVGPKPAFTAASIANAASFDNRAIAPGQIITIFGSNFGARQLTYGAYFENRLQPVAGGTRVYFDGRLAPMLYSAPGQISTIVPYGLGATTQIVVEQDGATSEPVSARVNAAAPGVFACQGREELPVLVTANNGRISCDAGFPGIPSGGIVTFYLTGDGVKNRELDAGDIPTNPYPYPTGGLTIRFGGVDVPACDANWVGMVYPGVTQVNVCVPRNLPSGQTTLEVLAGGVPARTLRVPIQ